LVAKEKSVELLLFKQQHVVEQEKQIALLNSRIVQIKNGVQQMAEKKSLFEEKIIEFNPVEQEYVAAKAALDAAFVEERKIEIAVSVAKEKKSNAEKNKLVLEKEVCEKEVLLRQMLVLKKAHDWLMNSFYPLVELIEKQVLTRVYLQFNELFQQWFGLLVDDEMFSARLDDSFAPVLQQNGFDTVAENLSGGEKTACALAYRLALNKVINDVMALVQTKDLLILDEPTDGFSDAQLDRVRDVLNYLNLKQVVIVSHERKVEGFVDAIIRLQKQAHVSVVGESFI